MATAKQEKEYKEYLILCAKLNVKSLPGVGTAWINHHNQLVNQDMIAIIEPEAYVLDTENKSDEEIKLFMIESIVSVIQSEVPEATVATVFTHDGHRALFMDVLNASIKEIELRSLQHPKTDQALKMMKQIKYVLDHRKSTSEMLERAVEAMEAIKTFITKTDVDAVMDSFLLDYKAWKELGNV